MSNSTQVSRPAFSRLSGASLSRSLPNSIARDETSVVADQFPHPAARTRLPHTREAKPRPGRVNTGTPIHSASEAVVWAP